MDLTTALILIYSAWALYSGNKVLTGRSEWLDRKEPINRICKLISGLMVGYFVGIIYLIAIVLRFL